jgi:TRAP-type C4-dicarboxylate transport system substrate-binding protein
MQQFIRTNKEEEGNMKRFLGIVGIIVLTGVVMFGLCSNAVAAADSAQPIKLSFNLTVSKTSYLVTEVLEPWIKQVEKATNGRVVFEVYYSGTLLKMDMAWDGLQKGLVDIADVSFANLPGLATFLDVVSMPDLKYTSSAHQGGVAWKLLETSPEIQNEFKANKMLLLYSPGLFMVETSKKQVKARDDMKGLKMRISAGESTQIMNELAGGVSVTMVGPEIYQNIQKGVADGAFVNFDLMQSFRLYEVAPYVTHGPFNSGVKGIAISLLTWNKLPKDVQDQIMSVSGLAGSVFWSKAYDKSGDAARAKAKAAGYPLTEYRLTQEQTDQWLKTDGQKVYDWWAKRVTDKAKKGGIADADGLPKKLHGAALKITNTYKP